MQDKQNLLNTILESLNWRYATKIFDATKHIDEKVVETILESGRLSPSSLGLEPWKFILIRDKNIRQAIFEASKQPKVLDASHLILIAARTDVSTGVITDRLDRTALIQGQKIEELAEYKTFLEKGVSEHIKDNTLLTWARAQTYIPLGAMVLTASLLDIDNCPMEGFDAKKVDEILGLSEKNLTAVTMLALGIRGEDPQALRPKIRQAKSDAILEI